MRSVLISIACIAQCLITSYYYLYCPIEPGLEKNWFNWIYYHDEKFFTVFALGVCLIKARLSEYDRGVLGFSFLANLFIWLYFTSALFMTVPAVYNTWVVASIFIGSFVVFSGHILYKKVYK